MIAGKVLMGRNCPAFLRDTAQSGHDDSAELIARWQGRGCQMYALTPRFEPPSRRVRAGHVAENVDEVKSAATLFPGHRTALR